jgi:hypothetical protein
MPTWDPRQYLKFADYRLLVAFVTIWQSPTRSRPTALCCMTFITPSARSSFGTPGKLVELCQTGADRARNVGLLRNLREKIGIVGHGEGVQCDGLENG